MRAEPPRWYARLKQVHKDVIKKIIGESTSASKELEDEIMDKTGTTRDDIKKLLDWWFKDSFSINRTETEVELELDEEA